MGILGIARIVAGLAFLVWWAESSVARQVVLSSGAAWLLGWIIFGALLQLAFHRPFPRRGRSQFVFTTPLVVFGACCVAGGAILESILRVRELSWAVFLGGNLLFAFGLVLRTSALRTLGDLFHFNIRIVEGHRVVTTGLFRHMRHPSYTGLLVMGLAAPLIANAYWSFLSFPILLSCVLVRIHYEEEALWQTLPEYAEYARRTKRLVPGVY